MPPPLTWQRVVLDWQPDPTALLLILTATVLYAAGVRRVARSGRTWPGSRTGCFAAGISVVAVATLSGLAAYENVLFSVHMVQHMLLGMVAPLLLSLSAPVTLLLGASGSAGRLRVKRVLASVPARILGHPAPAWLLFVGSPFALYFSPVYELSLRNTLVHALVHAHFLITGSLFCWQLVGVDPVPHRHPPAARMLYAVLALPFHAFLGIAIMGSTTVLAGDYYADLGRSWGASAVREQNTGGGLLWGAGDLVGFVLVVLLLRQWVRQEEVASAREDRRLDAAAEVTRAAGPAPGGQARLTESDIKMDGTRPN